MEFTTDISRNTAFMVIILVVMVILAVMWMTGIYQEIAKGLGILNIAGG